MNHLAVLLSVCVLVTSVANAQERQTRPFPPTAFPPPGSSSTTSSQLAPSNVKGEQSYFLLLREFRIKTPLDYQMTAPEIAKSFDQLKKDGKVELIDTIRLTALEYNESMVMFGKRTSVTTGVARNAQGQRQLSLTSVQMGTTVRATVSPQDSKVLLKLSYDASRMEGVGTEESPPDTITVQFSTSLLLELGMPTLVGGSTAEESHCFLMVTISK
jgi:hypothetical protein